ncbi:MAG: cyclic nucleotide-binding domain-containing protein [Candidatus Nitrohelix vancouverensis]|uniref:Cyclic nucleotide-binding domain-containing protein n=1 Tax=Candidatus Nitrohelix vancouverensis TaxID=2705534 RepID=A0A7T0C1N2_9BACT|nr:MAG: cyclic nucleotide-binding domain-containing protein [Candidatus Nitrohelix vancouverensis]
MFTLKEYRKGKAIIRQGTHGTSAFILKKGRVEVTREDNGQVKKICELKENDVFGEMAMVSDKPRMATVRALEDCQVAILTQESFMKLPNTNPAVARIKKIMVDRLKGKKG